MTRLMISNDTDYAVVVCITLGATPGCLQDVSAITVGGIPVTPISPLQGSFVLPPDTLHRVQYPNEDSVGLNGNFSFGTPPLNCPCPEFPEGVNLAEFIINNGFQENGQETVDISCVCGANAYLAFDLSAEDWTANGGTIPVEVFENDTRYENKGLVGVFPYGCDTCTASVAPPECVGLQPDQANAEPICTVQRPAGSNAGGDVTVVYRGPTPIPA